PTDVFRSVKVDDEEMQRIKAEEGLEVLKPELGTRPRVYYKNLHLMTTCMVGGTVVAMIKGVEECAEGAEVVLKHKGSEIARTATDTFGEFKFDKLETGSGLYEIEASSGSSGRTSKSFELGEESLYLGVMTLSAAA
ncbi:MAG: oxidoreductase, partial [Gammaproteobacteria bacterium]